MEGGENGLDGHSSCPAAVQGVPWWGGVGQPLPLQASCSSLAEPPAAVVPAIGFLHPAAVQQSSSPVFEEGGTDGANTESQSQSAAPMVLLPAATADYMLPTTQLDPGYSMGHAAYPYANPYFGGMVAAYGAQAVIHPDMLGLQHTRMPLPSEMTEEEPVYVNAKQYHGILRRRQSRAKAESENRLAKSRKPYLHESRHQHALRRARGCGGRFLNTKAKGEAKTHSNSTKSSEEQPLQGSCTPDSKETERNQEALSF